MHSKPVTRQSYSLILQHHQAELVVATLQYVQLRAPSSKRLPILQRHFTICTTLNYQCSRFCLLDCAKRFKLSQFGQVVTANWPAKPVDPALLLALRKLLLSKKGTKDLLWVRDGREQHQRLYRRMVAGQERCKRATQAKADDAERGRVHLRLCAQELEGVTGIVKAGLRSEVFKVAVALTLAAIVETHDDETGLAERAGHQDVHVVRPHGGVGETGNNQDTRHSLAKRCRDVEMPAHDFTCYLIVYLMYLVRHQTIPLIQSW